jgi:hypothetical protein
MIRYYDRLKKIEEMFPLLHAAYKESISIDDSNHASWFSSIKCISNKIAQSLDLKNNKISNAILNKFFINEWNKNKEKFSDDKLSTYIKPGIHDTSFASKSPFKKTWIKKT